MGILDSSKGVKTTPAAAKRTSTQMDFANLAPLKQGGTVGFSAFRDSAQSNTRKSKARKAANGSAIEDSAIDSDEDDDDEAGIVGKMEDVDDKDIKTTIDADEAKFSGELADNINRIKVCNPRLRGVDIINTA